MELQVGGRVSGLGLGLGLGATSSRDAGPRESSLSLLPGGHSTGVDPHQVGLHRVSY